MQDARIYSVVERCIWDRFMKKSAFFLSRSHRGTPETFNGSSGTVQDISPPGTPTSDDTITHPSNISTQPLFTPPIINAASLSVAAAARLVLQPQLVTTPILSPNILFNNGVQLAQPYLHPLQQALILKQQVQVPTIVSNSRSFSLYIQVL